MFINFFAFCSVIKFFIFNVSRYIKIICDEKTWNEFGMKKRKLTF